MSLRRRFTPPPFNGESEAPDYLKLEGQARKLVNYIPRAPIGLQRRPPLTFTASTHDPEGADWRDGGRILHVREAEIDWALGVLYSPVTDSLDGFAQRLDTGELSPVTITAAAIPYLKAGYLSGTALPIDSVTVAGTTLIWNKTVTVQPGTVDTPDVTTGFTGTTTITVDNYDPDTEYSITVTMDNNPSETITVSFRYNTTYTPPPGGAGIYVIDPAYMNPNQVAALLFRYASQPWPHNPPNHYYQGTNSDGAWLEDWLIARGFAASWISNTITMTHNSEPYTVTINGQPDLSMSQSSPPPSSGSLYTTGRFTTFDPSETYTATLSLSGAGSTTVTVLGSDLKSAVISRYGPTEDSEMLVQLAQYMFTGAGYNVGTQTNGFLYPFAQAEGFEVATQNENTLTFSHYSQSATLALAPASGTSVTNAPLGDVPTVNTFEDLPTDVSAGTIYKVAAYDNEDSAGFYVVWEDNPSGSRGRWRETISPTATTTVDISTWPLVADYDKGTDSWVITQGDWKGRTVGDDILSPDPDFIGEQITDISFYRGRLVFLYKEGVAFSDAQDAFNFYPTSLISLINSDPLFLQSTLAKETTFRWLVNYVRRLVIIGDDGVFEVTAGGSRSASGGILTPRTARLESISFFRGSAMCRPFAIGQSLYFTATTGDDRAELLTLNVQGDLVTTTSVSAHVPSLLKQVEDVVAMPSHWLAVFQTKPGGGQSTLVCYSSLISTLDPAQQQHALYRWIIGDSETASLDTVQLMSVGNRIYVYVTDLTGTLSLAYLDLDFDKLSVQGTSMIHLDMLSSVTGTYDPMTDTTFFTPPEYTATAYTAVLRQDTETETHTARVPLEYNAITRTLTIEGDWSEADVVCGIPYTSMWHLPAPSLSQGVPDYTANVVIQSLLLRVLETGHVQVYDGETCIEDVEAYLSTFPSQTSLPNHISGDVWTSIGMEATELLDIRIGVDSWLPQTIIGLTWTGFQNPR